MYSIRRRLLLVLVAGFGLLIGATGLFLATELEARLTEEFDGTLLAKARALAALTEQEGGQIEFDYTPEHMPEFERKEDPEYFQFRLDDGSMLFRSPHLHVDLPRASPTDAEPVVRDLALPDGRAGRAVELAYTPLPPEEGDDPEDAVEDASDGPTDENRGLILTVARSRESLDTFIGRTRLAIFGIGGMATLLAALLVWRALAAGFRPIDAIGSQVEALDAERLSTRVSLPKTPRELAAVVAQLNALLDRLDSSFERERRFTGNVAHELRTPLAELRSLASVGAQWPDDRESVVEFFSDVENIAGRMEAVITDLLLLARCHAGVERVDATPILLRDAIEDAWRPLAEAAGAGGLRIRVDVPAGLVVDTDSGKLAIILANVLGNAVSYARPKTEIRCSAAHADGRFQLEIANAADPLSDAELAQLAEPFWRKDESRSSEEHAGLGLSLVTAVSAVLGWRVRFDQDAQGRFRVRLSGPASESRALLDPAESPA